MKTAKKTLLGSTDLTKKLAHAEDLARICLVRYFIIHPHVDTVIAAIFGSQFEEDNPDGYEEVVTPTANSLCIALCLS